MKPIQLFTLTLVVSMSVIIGLLFRAQNPIDREFQKALSTVMNDHSYPSEEVALIESPELSEIKTQINQVRQWKFEIQQAMHHPAGIKEEASQALQRKMIRVQDLESSIRHRLKKLAYSQNQAVIHIL